MTGGSIHLHQIHHPHNKCDLYKPRLQGQKVPRAREQCQTFDMGIIYVRESSTGLELVAMVAIQNKSEALIITAIDAIIWLLSLWLSEIC